MQALEMQRFADLEVQHAAMHRAHGDRFRSARAKLGQLRSPASRAEVKSSSQSQEATSSGSQPMLERERTGVSLEIGASFRSICARV